MNKVFSIDNSKLTLLKTNGSNNMSNKEELAPWQEQLSKVEQCSQRQDFTLDQLEDLCVIAQRFGFYDAADKDRY